MKPFLLTITLLTALCVSATPDRIKDLVGSYRQLGGEVKVLDETDNYLRVSMADTAFVEVFVDAPEMRDKIIFVYTACAPKCSSCARVYNKEWELLFPLTPPFRSIFPLATIDKATGRVIWTDNDDWEY